MNEHMAAELGALGISVDDSNNSQVPSVLTKAGTLPVQILFYFLPRPEPHIFSALCDIAQSS